MKLWTLAFVVAALPGFCEEGTVPPRSYSPPPIALYTQFEQAIDPDVQAALQDELAVIMEPLGLAFTWRSLQGRSSNEVSIELAVITFKGTCSNASMLRYTESGGALGWTHVSDGIILPFTDIQCDRVRGFIQRELLHLPAAQRDDALGKALARVVAHELYHIFANTTKHGSCGVGKSAYSVQELVADEFRFDHKESDALREKGRRTALSFGGI